MSDLPEYRWPTLKPVIRQYVVRDDRGRYGIAYLDNCYHKDVLFAHPIDVTPQIAPQGVRGAETIPANAILMTDTTFHLHADGSYRGTWYDDTRLGQIPDSDLRTLTIVDDLGYRMSDKMAELFLSGSDQMGHWDKVAAGIVGKHTSKRKAKSSAANGKLGGRPRRKKRISC